MNSPRVTVLMTVYNGLPYIAAAVESILSQTFTDFEFLIINDGSPDNSMAAVAEYRDDRIRVVDNPENIGQTRSLNRGLQLARGELIARLDQDDIALPERLEKQVAFADANPQVAALGTAATIIDEQGIDIGSAPVLTSERTLRWGLLFHNVLSHPSVMFRRSIDPRIVWRFVLGALPGAIVGALFAASLPPDFIRWILTAMVAVSLFTAWRMPHLRLKRRMMLPAGAVIGGLTGTSGGAGILTAPVLLSMKLSGEAFVGTMSACVSVMHVGRIIGYGAAGLMTPAVLADSAVVAVAIFAGNLCGKELRRFTQKVPGRTLEYSVLVICATFAIVGFAE